MGKGKVYTLAYADDLAVLAEDEMEMKGLTVRRDIWTVKGWKLTQRRQR